MSLIDDLRALSRYENSDSSLGDDAANEIERLRKALQEIAAMDEQQQRADDMGRAARIAHAALYARPGGEG